MSRTRSGNPFFLKFIQASNKNTPELNITSYLLGESTN